MIPRLVPSPSWLGLTASQHITKWALLGLPFISSLIQPRKSSQQLCECKKVGVVSWQNWAWSKNLAHCAHNSTQCTPLLEHLPTPLFIYWRTFKVQNPRPNLCIETYWVAQSPTDMLIPATNGTYRNYCNEANLTDERVLRILTQKVTGSTPGKEYIDKIIVQAKPDWWYTAVKSVYVSGQYPIYPSTYIQMHMMYILWLNLCWLKSNTQASIYNFLHVLPVLTWSRYSH